jgi:hypothetical protein
VSSEEVERVDVASAMSDCACIMFPRHARLLVCSSAAPWPSPWASSTLGRLGQLGMSHSTQTPSALNRSRDVRADGRRWRSGFGASPAM